MTNTALLNLARQSMDDFDAAVAETRQYTARRIGEVAEVRAQALRALSESEGANGSTRKVAKLLGVSHQTIAVILRRHD